MTAIIESNEWIVNEMIEIGLPSLQSIQLGENALSGRGDDDSCSLTMRSNKEMI